MPTPILKVDDEGRALPGQLVPLRMAYFIAGWSPKLLLQMLSRNYRDDLPSLSGLEVTRGRVGECPSSYYEGLLNKLPSDDDLDTQLRALPANHCVLSNEVKDAFDILVNSMGHEAAHDHNMELRWTPAFLDHEAVLLECPDLPLLAARRTDLSGRQEQRQESLKRYKKWWEEFQRLKAINSSTTASSAARHMASKVISVLPNGDTASATTIRTALSLIQTKLSAGIALTEAIQQALDSR